nr:MAG TPA: hypothetical protein [Bacteriophage sp.]
MSVLLRSSCSNFIKGKSGRELCGFRFYRKGDKL